MRVVVWLVALSAAATLARAQNVYGGSYQVPPAPIEREYAEPPPPPPPSPPPPPRVRHQEQTYGTPPPRVYATTVRPPARPPPEPAAEPYDIVEEPTTTPRPRSYVTPPTRPPPPPPRVAEPIRGYETPPPRVAEPIRNYETQAPPCPRGGRRHPATGECMRNECELGEHDCHENARCIDTLNSFTCACQSGYFDKSPNGKPGRNCVLPQNDCASGKHDCSRDAQCVMAYNGVSCICKDGFVDASPDRLKPGRVCKRLVNECEPDKDDHAQNDCSEHAECIDRVDGYECRCKSGYVDVDPAKAGRECELEDPCGNDKNDCAPEATCVRDKSSADGYTCKCPKKMRDISANPQRRPGRKCEETIETPIALVIVSNGSEPTPWSSKFAAPTNRPYEELAKIFDHDLGTTIGETRFGPAYLNTSVSKISSPKSALPSLDGGLIVNATVSTALSNGAVNACALFDEIVERIQGAGGYIGNGQLKVGDDVEKLNPCPRALCGGKLCNAALGEVCLNGRCGIDYCSDTGICPVNATCVNLEDHGECICKPGYVDVRNVSISIRVSAGLKEDQYCLRSVDLDYCALGLNDCAATATCIPLRGNYTCRCNEGLIDGNPDRPGRACAAAATLAASTVPLWLMLLLALLFLLLTLCCCLWALSRLRWFRRRGILDQSGSSYSDLVIPRPKVRSLDAESMGSGSSEFTIREEIERRVVTDVTRSEFRSAETEEEANEHEQFTHTENVEHSHEVR